MFGDTKKGSNKPSIKDDRYVGKNKRDGKKNNNRQNITHQIKIKQHESN